MNKRILITGSCGFIGSSSVYLALNRADVELVVGLDILSEISNPPPDIKDERYKFIQGDITDDKLISLILYKYDINCVFNYAASTHVDNSIVDGYPFIYSNVLGTYNLLNRCNEYYQYKKDKDFKFIQVSTDEIGGSLNIDDKPLTEDCQYNPRNIYSATKASAEHLVKAYINTENFPAIITRCCNNYGPGQHVEKFLPKVITNIFNNKPIPVYGKGDQLREWIYADDHNKAILFLLDNGISGETYNISTGEEFENIKILEKVIDIMKYNYNINGNTLVQHVTDRKGHDKRYRIDSTKIQKMGWTPEMDIDTGLAITIEYYAAKEKNIKLL